MFKHLLKTTVLFHLSLLFLSSHALAHEDLPMLLHAAHVFDGDALLEDAAVLVSHGKVVRTGRYASFSGVEASRIELGDASLLPGLIELHSHLRYHNIPADTVLQHGITSLRDLGGPLAPPEGGHGSLRVLSSGPILTTANGYPINLMGSKDIARAVADPASARQAVIELVRGGAAFIKVAIEPGGEVGAPWSSGHAQGHGHAHHAVHDSSSIPPSHAHEAKPGSWPLLSAETIAAIVDEAHRSGRKVIAHVGEDRGVRMSLKAGVDEWAHVPCRAIRAELLRQAVKQGVKIVSTVDTLSKCTGVAENARHWSEAGGKLYYGAEIAHPDIPWGIDSHELGFLMQFAGLSPLDVLKRATSDAGDVLGIPLLGRLVPGAPADLIAVRGYAMHNLKSLEYPDLVMSGGVVVVNRFSGEPKPGDLPVHAGEAHAH